MNNEALIEEIREMHGRQERREGEPPMCLSCSPADWPCDAVRAADALEAATRVPVQGETNGGREVLEHIRTTYARQRFMPNGDREALEAEHDGLEALYAAGEISFAVALDRARAVGTALATAPDAATEFLEAVNKIEAQKFDLRVERDAATERYKDAAEGNRIRLVHAQDDVVRAEAERDAAIRGRQEWYEGAQKITERADQAEAERDAALAAIERVRALETFSITDSYPAWTAVDHDDLLAALDATPDNGSLPNHCQSCGAWGTTEVHLRGCSLDGAPEPEGIARAVVGAIGGEGR